MREKPTSAASRNKNGPCAGNSRESNQAPAKAEAECPEGKDQEPGFLPMTMAWINSMNGLRRRKNALIGYSTSEDVTDSGRIIRRIARMSLRGSIRMASAINTYQPRP